MMTTEILPEINNGIDEDANFIRKAHLEAKWHVIGRSIINQPSNKDKTIFLHLAEKWKNETKYYSNPSEIINSKAYSFIISMGKTALPFILEDLKQTNDHWFYALMKITGENPINPENIGNVKSMAEDWIKWGKENNYC